MIGNGYQRKLNTESEGLHGEEPVNSNQVEESKEQLLFKDIYKFNGILGLGQFGVVLSVINRSKN